jgi:hypothetical protein
VDGMTEDIALELACKIVLKANPNGDTQSDAAGRG